MTSTNGNGIRRPFDTARKSNFTMQLIKLATCILVLVTKISSAESIITTSKVNDSSLIETLINILESCYTDRFSTMGVAGPSAGRIMTKMSLRDPPIPVAMIDETAGVAGDKRTDRASEYKLQVFVITTSDQTSVLYTYLQVWYSKWWNHMASFFFIDLTDSENGCSNADEILFQAWQFHMLNAKFVCVHKTRGRLIYTFNPYTKKAPTPWHLEATYQIKGHPWTVFVREYREDESDCYELDFDKTVDLGGYEVYAVGQELKYWSVNGSFTPWLVDKVRNVTAQFLIDALNAGWKVRSIPHEPHLGGVRQDLLNGAVDILVSPFIPNHSSFFGRTEPVMEFQTVIMTQYPGHKTQLDKLISVLDRSSRFGVFVVFMITLLFLKFWLKQPLVLSILDLILLICNQGLRRIPRETAPRIYLAGLFILVVTIQGIYSGIFASLLTKDVRLRTIDTVEDLARSGYKIYTSWFDKQLFSDKAFEGRFYNITGVTCVEEVLADSRAACVADNLAIYGRAAAENLHVSHKSFGDAFSVYLVRPDWPLIDRVNEVIRRAKAGGLLEVGYRLELNAVMRELESYEKQEEEPDVKVLTLEHLGFAFVILGIGLGCATITFIIEIATFDTALANFWNRIRR